MRRTLPIAAMLSLLLLSTLLAEDDPVAKATAARDSARAEVERVRGKMEARYVECERDFDLVRSDRWASLSAPFLPPLERAIKALEGDAAYEPVEDLTEAFGKTSVLSAGVSRLLAAAAAGLLKDTVGAGEKAEAPQVLADALAVVFPAESFADCWDQSFQDLPVVERWRAANEALQKAEKSLAEATAEARTEPVAPGGMVLVPKGRFEFGPWEGWYTDLRDNKRSKKFLRAYFIDRTEVTNAEFGAFLAGLDDEKDVVEWLPLGFQLEEGKVVVPAGQEDHPVRGLPFEAARAYARSVGKRLPTEEEWEKAARGEHGLVYPWGNDFDRTAANWKGRGFGTTTPVGKHPKDKSPYGVFDMAGNVSEMTATLAGAARKVAPRRVDNTESIVFRGGSYAESREQNVSGVYRWMINVDQRKDEVGFRCALSERDWKR